MPQIPYCIQFLLQLYEKVRELLQKADFIVKDTSYNLSRVIKWEILLVDFQQYHQYGTFGADQSLKDLAKKAKTCITSLQLEQGWQESLNWGLIHDSQFCCLLSVVCSCISSLLCFILWLCSNSVTFKVPVIKVYWLVPIVSL